VWVFGPVCFVNVSFALLAVFFDGLNGTTFAEFVAEKNLVGVILAVSFSVVGALVAARRPGNAIGWIYLAVGLSQGFVTFAYNYAKYALITAPGSLPGGEPMSVLGQIAWMPGLSLMLTYALLLFPTGRLPSRRWRPVAGLSAVPLLIMAPGIVWLMPRGGRTMLENPEQVEPGGVFGLALNALFPLMLVCGLASLASLVVRFRYSRGVERQQLKWFTYAAGLTLSLLILGEVVEIESIRLLDLALTPLVAAIPVATGVAILRYRLYDIDAVINRTLVYGALTVVLALTYLGGVVGLQRLLSPLVGEDGQLAVVASTLAIAALFNPLRRRIQDSVDRRFYRKKYDAQETLAAFGVRVRDEVDPERITDELILVTQKTLRPAHASLWLPEKDFAGIREIG
jgi:hypothetical protein